MANTKLILQVDNLDHKLISVDSEVAVNETFDIVFEGLSETEVGSTAKIELRTLSRKELVWVIEERIGRIEEGALGILDCKINTQNALDITRITSAKTILTLVLTDDYGNRTVYGTAQMRLHPGYGEGGESLVDIERSVEKHNVDPEAHKELFQSLRDEDTRILQEVDGKIASSKNAEVEARNQAISAAVNNAKDEMANAYKGDLTDFAVAAATSARASASSANAAAIAADKTVEKLGEAYEVVKTLNDKISQVDGKVEVAGRYAESAVGAAGHANRSAERAVGTEENIGVYVTQVSGLAAGIKQDADRAASVVGAVNDAKTAVETAKRQVEGFAEEVGGYKQTAVNAANAAGESASNAKGSANTAKGHADRAEKAAERAGNYVNIELPNKVAILDQSIDDKMSAVDAHLEQAQTAILGNISAKEHQVNTALDGKLATANTALDGKVSQAEQSRKDAEDAKTAAETAKGQAEGFASQASTSASNASKSEANAKTAEANAKSYATQAENATALKVDQRLNTSDNGPYPLIVRVDKDVYKLVAPKDTSNSWHYCCDGVAHYFAKYPSQLYVYGGDLKFVEALQVSYGENISSAEVFLKDFCTKIGDNYFIRWNGYPYSTHKIRKYDKSGAFVNEVVIDGIGAYNAFARVCRNERTNHLLIFSNYPDGAGYRIYDEDLTFLGEKRIDAIAKNADNWLRHLNVVGGFTLVSFAPTDATKTALFILDGNDDVQEVDAVTIRGSGAFTSEDLTASGRASANYFVPRMFYDMRSAYGQFNRHHLVDVTNGAKWYRIYVDSNAESLGEISVNPSYFNAIKVSSVPQTKYAENTLFVANGSGSNDGGGTYSQPVVNLTSSGILTKVADLYDGRNGFTEFAPDPFASIAIFGRMVIGNTRLARNDVATSRAYNLYPANNGAVMFTP